MDFQFLRGKKKLKKVFGDEIQLIRQRHYYRLTGTCNTWEDKVRAGLLGSKEGSRMHVVNDIVVAEDKKTKLNHENGAQNQSGTKSLHNRNDINCQEFDLGKVPTFEDESLEGKAPDVLVIGGGVIGTAIARELSKNAIDILLVEKEYDVAIHASSRNDGMIHPGVDIKPRKLKKKLNNIGNIMYDDLARQLDIEFKRCGQYLCFDNWRMKLILIMALPYFNLTVPGRARYISKKKLRNLEPGIADEIKGALFFDATGILCPFGLTIALAENAIQNGVNVKTDTVVRSMDVKQNRIRAVHTNRGTIYPKVVINAAGVFSEEIAKMADDRFFSIHPRKGSSVVLDKKAKKLINSIYSLIGQSSRKTHTKGGALVSTIHGNVLVGPSAQETNQKEDFTTERSIIEGVLEKHKAESKKLEANQTIAYFSGIRSATYEEDFIVEAGRNTNNIVHAAGIQSPGLTAAPAIAVEIANITKEILSKDMQVAVNERFNPHRKDFIRCSKMSYEQREELIKKDKSFGKIVCRCEEISEGEILHAMRRPLPCNTIDGIKRRVRPTAGRCQGGFCSPTLVNLIAKETNTPIEKIVKGYPEGNLLFDRANTNRREANRKEIKTLSGKPLEAKRGQDSWQNKSMVCIICPNSCTLKIEKTIEGDFKVSGNKCPRGKEFAIKELTEPSRTLTTTIAVSEANVNRVSVKTNKEVPKDKLFEIVEELKSISVKPPIKCGEIIVSNICQTGADIVSTAEVM